jgi:thymidylate synthase
MNNIDKHYQALLQDILNNGVEKSDRTGTGTISVFGRQIRHKMSDGFPLLTTKKMAWKSIVAELLWFLRGDTNIKFLLDYDCHIWDGDAYKRYKTVYDIESRESTYALEELHMLSDITKEEFIKRIKNDDAFAKKWGELGPIYGKQWRQWQGWMDMQGNEKGSLWYDQILQLVHSLKTNPDSRRLMVSAWNVAELDQMVLPPCHYGFQCYVREGKYLSLMWNQRSVDTFLGLPFNIASYALLLEILAKEVNMIPDELIGNLGDVHLYSNHIEQAKMQILRKPFSLPRVNITERNWYQHQLVKERLGPKTFNDIILSYRPDCFELIGYESHSGIKAPLSN